MKTTCVHSVVLAALFYPIHCLGQVSFAPDGPEWRFEGDQVEISSIDRQSALRIKNGAAYLDDAKFINGVIEFDVYTSGERTFVYLMFRGVSEQEYEDLYLRPHKSGLPDAVQYSPVFQRKSAWQLYHGESGTAAAVIPPNDWVHVRLELMGPKATIWVGDGAEPVLTVRELGRIPRAGWIALRGFVPANSPANYAAYFRNLTVTYSNEVDSPAAAATVLPDGLITSWNVSPAFDSGLGPIEFLPDGLIQGDWSTPPMQPNGTFEFLRSRQIPNGSRHWAVVAEVVLMAEEPQTCALHLGYSDEITVSLNGQLILYQDAGYRFENLRQDGLMHAAQITAYLPLKRRENTLRVVVADRFGGWGLSGRLVDCDEIEIL